MVLRFMKELCVGDGETGYCLPFWEQKRLTWKQEEFESEKIKCFGAKSYLILGNDFED